MRKLLAAAAFAAMGAGMSVALEDKPVAPALNFNVKSIDGKDVALSKYAGKVVLVVNVASKCGYTKQYAGLQQLHESYKDKGVALLGFPANEFGGQEPGSDEDIKAFCSTKYNVSFDMFSKLVVKGAGQDPFFKHLTDNATPAGDIGWNFEKFLIGKDGKIAGRFKSGVAPESAEMKAAIDAALAK